MNPSSHELPSIAMPEVAGPSDADVALGPIPAETLSMPTQGGPATQTAGTVGPGSAPAAPLQPSATDPAATTAAPTSNPTMADDSDLIEKEWVLKAKQIVEQTKNDPYLQNREVNRMKADYMKKRYNKDIKLDEA